MRMTARVLPAVLFSAALAFLPATSIADGSRQGIYVRGAWILEVRDPDGSLVTRREFQNALTDAGRQLIAQYLARVTTPGSWAIAFAGAPHPCPSPFACVITEPRVPGAASPNLSKNLTVASNPLRLSGNFTAPQAGSITSVGTYQGLCNSSTTPANCTTVGLNPSNQITGTTISPVSVTAGQQVALTVTISFETAP
jgi:hypothetical protein